MGSRIPQSASDILQRLFDVVLDEARTHPEFAEKLLKSLPFDSIARIEVNVEGPPRKAEARRAPAASGGAPDKMGLKAEAETFDPNAFSLIAALKALGEAALRQKLKAYNAKQLLSMVEEQRLEVDEKVFRNRKRATREMIDAIIAAIHFRIAGRLSAAS